MYHEAGPQSKRTPASPADTTGLGDGVKTDLGGEVDLKR